jgi:alkylation response protein AidB-like acyl-CoA dehydrogenase
LALGTGIDDVGAWQEDYLFSRVVSIYGGTRQIQYMTIARFLLGLPHD